jgi:Ca2+-transporting ATPase
MAPKAVVIRDGVQVTIPARELLPGDKVLLYSGDTIAADGIITQSYDLLVNEAIFTGEDRGVVKDIEKNNTVSMGTTILSGYGEMTVVSIGMRTTFGKLNETLHTIKDEETPLQKKLASFSRTLTYVVLVLTVIIFLLGVLRQEPIIEFAKIAVILAVASIPEALAVTVTVILANGMKRVKAKNGLVRKLVAMETLGVTSVICVDKTGTITTGKMQVTESQLENDKEALKAFVLNNFKQSSEELALLEFVRKERQELFTWADDVKKIHLVPFDSAKKYTITETDEQEGKFYLTGAPDIILNFCQCTQLDREKVLLLIDDYAKNGLKLIGAAIRHGGKLGELSGYTWVGLVGIQDPLRPDVKEVIQTATAAGIAVKIVTGDYKTTAEKIATQLGFIITPQNGMSGEDIDKLDDGQLARVVQKIAVFSRVTPDQKMRIVAALKKRGEIVAMTGDGVNDVLALKRADIGIAVSSATDIARETADLVLLDDSFKTIIEVCLEGRRTLANIKKSLGYMVSDSFAESTLILLALFAGLPAPLTILQILWGHLICDGLPDIALCFEDSERKLSEENPKSLTKQPLLDRWTLLQIPLISGFIGVSSFILYRYYLTTTGDLQYAQTMAFIAVALADLLYLFSFKDLTKPWYKILLLDNKMVLWSVFYVMVLALAVLYIPFFTAQVGVHPLRFSDWGFILGISLASFAMVEVVKVARKKFG